MMVPRCNVHLLLWLVSSRVLKLARWLDYVCLTRPSAMTLAVSNKSTVEILIDEPVENLSSSNSNPPEAQLHSQ